MSRAFSGPARITGGTIDGVQITGALITSGTIDGALITSGTIDGAAIGTHSRSTALFSNGSFTQIASTSPALSVCNAFDSHGTALMVIDGLTTIGGGLDVIGSLDGYVRLNSGSVSGVVSLESAGSDLSGITLKSGRFGPISITGGTSSGGVIITPGPTGLILAGNTVVTSTNTFNVGLGQTTLGGGLAVTGTTALANLNLTGAINNTAVGNSLNLINKLVVENYNPLYTTFAGTKMGFLIQRNPADVIVEGTVFATGVTSSATTVNGTTVTLAPTGAPVGTDICSGMYIRITAVAETHRILNYNTTSRVVTITTAFNGITTDKFNAIYAIGSTYTIYSQTMHGMVSSQGLLQLCSLNQSLVTPYGLTNILAVPNTSSSLTVTGNATIGGVLNAGSMTTTTLVATSSVTASNIVTESVLTTGTAGGTFYGLTINNSVVGPGNAAFIAFQINGSANSKLAFGWQQGTGVQFNDQVYGNAWLSQANGGSGYIKTLNNILDNGTGALTTTGTITAPTITSTGSVSATTMTIQTSATSATLNLISSGVNTSTLSRLDGTGTTLTDVGGNMLRIGSGIVRTANNVLDNGSGAMTTTGTITAPAMTTAGLLTSSSILTSVITSTAAASGLSHYGVVIDNSAAANNSATFTGYQVAGILKLSAGWQQGTGIHMYDHATVPNGMWLSQAGGGPGYIKTLNNILDNGTGALTTTGTITAPTITSTGSVSATTMTILTSATSATLNLISSGVNVSTLSRLDGTGTTLTDAGGNMLRIGAGTVRTANNVLDNGSGGMTTPGTINASFINVTNRLQANTITSLGNMFANGNFKAAAVIPTDSVAGDAAINVKYRMIAGIIPGFRMQTLSTTPITIVNAIANTALVVTEMSYCCRPVINPFGNGNIFISYSSGYTYTSGIPSSALNTATSVGGSVPLNGITPNYSNLLGFNMQIQSDVVFADNAGYVTYVIKYMEIPIT